MFGWHVYVHALVHWNVHSIVCYAFKLNLTNNNLCKHLTLRAQDIQDLANALLLGRLTLTELSLGSKTIVGFFLATMCIILAKKC